MELSISNVLKMGENQLQPLKRSATAPKSKTGTKVTFMPDPTIFSTTDFKFNTIAERIKESAFLLEGRDADADRSP